MTKKQEQALKELPTTGFHFSEEAHLYVLDGKPLTGVTTILSVIAKPALIQWSADEAVKYLGWVSEKYSDIEAVLKNVGEKLEIIKGLDNIGFFKMLCEARTQHAKRKKSAGSVGTDVHAIIENLVKEAIEKRNGELLNVHDAYENPLVAKFAEWAKENHITFLESEKRLFSKEHWYAGTCDLVFLKDGKKHIGDIKTSSGIYGREFFFQMAGYQIALEEQGLTDIFANTIIRCGKDGSFEVVDSFDTESDKKGFLAALALYRALELN